jgi:hypothetical protein
VWATTAQQIDVFEGSFGRLKVQELLTNLKEENKEGKLTHQTLRHNKILMLRY